MSELHRLLERLKRTEAGADRFADWKASEVGLGNLVADTCTLPEVTANALCDDILTVILYFVNHLSHFNVTISDLVRETVSIATTRKLNQSDVITLMTAQEHFKTAHQTQPDPSNIGEWEKANTALKTLTQRTSDLLLMPK